jgi:fatty acid synthase
MDSLIAVEIRQVLERDYDKIMTNEEIRKIKVKELKALSIELAAQSDLKNLATGEDDLHHALKLSMFASDEPFELLNPNSTSGRPAFFFPPIDGAYLATKKLVENVSRPFMRCNWTHECDQMETIEKLASHYIQQIEESYPDVTSYDLIGYSFGTLIALEIAAQLESRKEKNPVNHITIFDGSPKSLRALVVDNDKKVGLAGQDSPKMERITRFANIVFNLPEIDKILAELKTEHEMLSALVELIEQKTAYKSNTVDLAGAVDRFFKKRDMAMLYDLNTIITKDVKLYRAAGSESYMTDENGVVDIYYGLQDLCRGTLDQVVLPGEHGSFMTQNDEVVIAQLEGLIVYA